MSLGSLISEIIEDKLLLGPVTSLFSLRKHLVDRLSIVRCMTGLEWEMLSSHPQCRSVKDCPVFSVKINDAPHEDIEDYFMDSAAFIGREIGRGQIVLCHCSAGVSRSATIVISYLIQFMKMELRKALSYVKDRRPVIRPNAGFLTALLNFNKHSGIGALSSEQQGTTPGEERKTPPPSIDQLMNESISSTGAEGLLELQQILDKYDGDQEFSTAFRPPTFPNENSRFQSRPSRSLRETALKYQEGSMSSDEEGLEQTSVYWCPAPVRVGIEDYFTLSGLGAKNFCEPLNDSVSATSEEGGKQAPPIVNEGAQEKNRRPSEADVLASYIAMVQQNETANLEEIGHQPEVDCPGLKDLNIEHELGDGEDD